MKDGTIQSLGIEKQKSHQIKIPCKNGSGENFTISAIGFEIL